MAEDEPALLDPNAVNRTQTHYVRLVWNYLLATRGYEQTPMLFSQLLDQMLRLQAISRLFRSYLTAQIAGPDTVEHVDPLMKTILHISATTS